MNKRSIVRSYSLALAATLIAVALRWSLEPLLAGERPLATLYGAIAIAAWLGGVGPALLAMALGYYLCDLLFVPPVGRSTTPQLVGLAMYLISSAIIIALAHIARLAQERAARAEAQLRANNEDLRRLVCDLETSEQKLREGDARLRIATRVARMFAWEADFTSATIHWSGNAGDVLGCAQGALPPHIRDSLFFLSPEDEPRIRREFEDCVKRRGAVGQWEFRGQADADGRKRWFLAQAHIEYDESGRPLRMIGATKDITERKEVEVALRASEERLRLATSAGGVGVWDWDIKRNTVTWSEALYAIHGLEPAQFGGTVEAFSALIDPDDRERVQAALVQALQRDHEYDLEFRARRPDGATVWIYTRAQIIRDEAGAAVRMLGGTVDVTRRKRAELALQVSETRYRTLTEALPFAVWQTDADGRSEFANVWFHEYTGLTPQTMQNRGWLSTLHAEDREPFVRLWDRALVNGEMFQLECRMRRAGDGEYRWFHGLGVPVRDQNGALMKWVGACVDIHDRRAAELALQASEQQLRLADRRKDEFLATLAHELRNPLAPIRNAVHILRARASADAQSLWARDVIERQVTQMTRLLEDLLDVSRISRGKIELRKGFVTLQSILDVAIETSRPLIDESGHELVVVMPSEPIWLNADVVRLAQVLANLLNNAAKYSDQGGFIRLSVERAAEEVFVGVEDHGIGMTADMLPRIFEMFSQAEASLNRSKGGLGIGLSLAKFLVEAHGGKIKAHSPGLGLGSVFTICLPIVAERTGLDNASGGATSAHNVSKHRILIADDLKDTADSLAMLLKMIGHEVRTAYDGEHAVALAESFRPDIAVLDVGMPQLNGYETCRRIRAQPWGRDTLMIAVTGWAQEEDRRRSQEAGFQFHLAKPIDTSTLLGIIAAASERSVSRPLGEAS